MECPKFELTRWSVAVVDEDRKHVVINNTYCHLDDYKKCLDMKIREEKYTGTIKTIYVNSDKESYNSYKYGEVPPPRSYRYPTHHFF